MKKHSIIQFLWLNINTFVHEQHQGLVTEENVIETLTFFLLKKLR